jgi:hypothetical protein
MRDDARTTSEQTMDPFHAKNQPPLVDPTTLLCFSQLSNIQVIVATANKETVDQDCPEFLDPSETQ